jgi:hypothetical protein
MKKAMVFCSQGLGDGLLFLVISYNLFKNGYIVDTFHPFLSILNDWFEYTQIKSYPLSDKNLEFLGNYDLIIINSDYNFLNKSIVQHSKQNYPDKTYELHPSTCKGKNPPIGNLKFDFTKTITENLQFFCKNFLNLKNVELTNFLRIPKHLKYRKYLKRIAIHPSSKDVEKNWPKEKFYRLCKKLKKIGFEPNLILTSFERKQFEDIMDIEKPEFKDINEIASFIYESGYMLGNDSGIAHLASSLKIPTLTIFSTKRKERFWKPNFFISKTVVSWPLLNISGFRLREKYWKNTISVNRVLNNFKKLICVL